MDHILIYFPYALQENPKSGSGVRPKKIVEAFRAYGKENNLEAVVISGNSDERKKRTQDYIQSGLVKNASFCYMENSTSPFWLTDKKPKNLGVDTGFWNYLKRHNVPISCFYRDVYWKFDDMYAPPKGINALRPIMKWIYNQELKAYAKVVDHLYLPSLEMNEYVAWKGSFGELPPGMEKLPQEEVSEAPAIPKGVFVGGITDQIGIMTMLEGFDLINKETEVHLELVCRKEEYQRYPAMHAYENRPWLTVSHKSGAELKGVYKNASVALIPRERNAYHDFAVPVKMFEYLAYGLPIVATNCKAHARIIETEGYGVITEVSPEGFARGIQEAIDPSVYPNIKANVVDKAYERNSWRSRVEKVVKDMEAIQKGSGQK